MIFTRVTSLIFLSSSLLLSACGTTKPQKSVQRLSFTDDHANSYYLQANYNHASGRITQVEIEQRNAQDGMYLSGAQDASGQGERRLRDLDQGDPDRNQLVGPADVDVQYTLQQISVRSVFHVDDKGHFQFDVSPQLGMIRMDGSYRTSTQALSTELDKFGGGIVLNMNVPVYKTLSLNLAENWMYYSGDTSQSTLSFYLRVQPSEKFHIDIGQYTSQLDFGTDSQLSYEQRVLSRKPCETPCSYIYDGTQNSDFEMETAGYRIGLGWYF